MRKMLGLIVVLMFHVAALGQTGQASWSNLSGLKPGLNVRVVDGSKKAREGEFKSISDTAILLTSKDGEFSVERQDVRSVKLMKGMSRTQHIVLGAAIGAGAGAGIGAASSSGFWVSKGKGAAVFAAMGVVVGGAIGAALPVHHPTLYEATSH